MSVAIIAEVVTLEQAQEIQLRVRIGALTARLERVAEDAAAISKDPNRSPSPPPEYDNTGSRTNTREMRMRRALEKERNELVEEILTLNPILRVGLG